MGAQDTSLVRLAQGPALDSRDHAEEIERDSLEIDEESEGGYRSDSEMKNTLKRLLDKNNGGDGLLWCQSIALGGNMEWRRCHGNEEQVADKW